MELGVGQSWQWNWGCRESWTLHVKGVGGMGCSAKSRTGPSRARAETGGHSPGASDGARSFAVPGEKT